ncbi:hypothetical protein Elgi_32270 [Paenibacillus elgii]|nr:hypothetical protein Elgi_32270 [Paenibacillus elgii]
MVQEKQEDGEIIEKPQRTITGWYPTTVFDVSQTNDKPLPVTSVVQKLGGETELYIVNEYLSKRKKCFSK